MAETQEPARSRRHRRRGAGNRTAETGDGGIGRQQSDHRPTQLSVTTAMRAREVATPTPADLAEAADQLELVRRHYVPPNAID